MRRLRALAVVKDGKRRVWCCLRAPIFCRSWCHCCRGDHRQSLELVATAAWLQRHQALLARFQPAPKLQLVSDEVLKAALTTVNPDGVAALLPLELLPRGPQAPTFALALDRIQDPGNLGTLLRTALAADVEMVWQGSGADPLNPKVVRSSSGAVLRLPHQRFRPIRGRRDRRAYAMNSLPSPRSRAAGGGNPCARR